MTSPACLVRVVRNDEASRYEAQVDGKVVGFANYRREGNKVVFTHTEVDPASEGHGLGSQLATRALEDVRAQGLSVVARCPFIIGFMRRHPKFADLLD